ncbi:MAG: acyl carrier protein [Lachnospiraceae bacterium]|nr:acyl carrier protein [Lachnospiraceae bacterium]MCR5769301.1 acyl carrier protein [Lachnospiraceae bacterium]
MKHEEILANLKDIMKLLRPDADLALINEDTRLIEDLGMDSLFMLMMAMQSEKVFSIHFDSMDTSKLETVGDVCRYIEGKL